MREEAGARNAGLHTTAIALGSNLPSQFGGPAENLREALRRLEALGELTAVSKFRETEPVGYVDQPRFVNASALFKTALEPYELMRSLLEIELAMGRDRSRTAVAKGPRVIDLDLLLYEDQVIETPHLTLPHPAMHQRRFVLEPLAEIAPGWMHPRLRWTVGEMLRRLEETEAATDQHPIKSS